jgi:hypothetical protein
MQQCSTGTRIQGMQNARARERERERQRETERKMARVRDAVR